MNADYILKGHALCSELDLDRLARDLGEKRRLRWEEPLLLDPQTVSPLARGTFEAPCVYAYNFGSAVFVNCDDQTITRFAARLDKGDDIVPATADRRFTDSYRLRIEQGAAMTIADDGAIIGEFRPALLEVACAALAKSVALERVEESIDLLMDEMEGMISSLKEGRLRTSDADLAQVSARILGFKYRSISYIMVLEKPELTWEDHEADLLYQKMAQIFELNPRYQEIRHKTETLLDIIGAFGTLSHARRAARLEWIIIVLIAVEIVIYLVEILKK